MATNPRIPDDRDPKQQRGPVLLSNPEPPRSAVPGVVLAIITAVLLLAAVFYFMPRAPKKVAPPAAAEVPAQPVPGQLQFSDMNMTPDPTGKALNLDGQVTNASNETITGIMAAVQFTLKNGQTTTVNAPVQAIAIGNNARNTDKITGSVQNMVNDPIKPGAQRAIEIQVNGVPADWNHTMPGLQVVTTTGTQGAPPVK